MKIFFQICYFFCLCSISVVRALAALPWTEPNCLKQDRHDSLANIAPYVYFYKQPRTTRSDIFPASR